MISCLKLYVIILVFFFTQSISLTLLEVNFSIDVWIDNKIKKYQSFIHLILEIDLLKIMYVMLTNQDNNTQSFSN